MGKPDTLCTKEEWHDNDLIPTRLVTGWRVCIDYRKLNEATRKDHFPLPFMDQMLERLAGNQYYCFLDGFSGYFQIPIDPKDQEKTTFTCPYGTFAYRRMPFGLCNAPGTFQRCMMAIFHDMIEKTMEVFMDDFSVFGDSFSTCLSHLEKMLKRCEDTNLSLNWEKSHFMVKEGIVLGHKISKSGIEVDRAKVENDVEIRVKKGAENLASHTTLQLETLTKKKLRTGKSRNFSDSKLFGSVALRDGKYYPWFATLQTPMRGTSLSRECRPNKKTSFSKMSNITSGTTPFYSRSVLTKSLIQDFIGPRSTRMPTTLSPDVTFVNVKAKFRNVMRCHKTLSKFAKSLTFGALILWGHSRLQEGTNIYSWQLITYQNGLKQKCSPPMMPELFANFLEPFSRFGCPSCNHK
ncbi:reverse transcriptase domain-containing protein [Tanacetum coccineum]